MYKLQFIIHSRRNKNNFAEYCYRKIINNEVVCCGVVRPEAKRSSFYWRFPKMPRPSLLLVHHSDLPMTHSTFYPVTVTLNVVEQVRSCFHFRYNSYKLSFPYQPIEVTKTKKKKVTKKLQLLDRVKLQLYTD